MSFKKKTAAIVLAASTMLGCAAFAGTADAATFHGEEIVYSGYDYYNLWYDIRRANGKEFAVVTDFREDNNKTSMDIPASITRDNKTYDVARVGDGTKLHGGDRIQSVKIADGVDVDKNAFNGCRQLKSIDLSADKDAYIDMYAFANNPQVESIKLPADDANTKRVEIQDYAFENCGKYYEYTDKHTTLDVYRRNSAYTFNGGSQFKYSLVSLNYIEASRPTHGQPEQPEQPAQPSQPVSQDALRFKIENGTAVITGVNKDVAKGNMVVPGTVTVDGVEYPVSRIGDGKQLEYADSVVNLTVTAPTVVIDTEAFYNEGNLQNVDLSAVKTLTVNARAFANSVNAWVKLPADADGNTITLRSQAFARTGCNRAANNVQARPQEQSVFNFIGAADHFTDSNIHIIGY